MRGRRMLYTLIALWIVFLAAGLIAGFFLPFWNYSKTYAPVIGAPGAALMFGSFA